MSFIKNYKKRLIFLFFLLLGLFATWYYYDNKNVIATVGSFKIREPEFKKEMLYRGGISINDLNKKQLLDEMIEKKLLLNKAYALGLDKDPKIQREYEYLLMGQVRKLFIEEPRSKIKIDEKVFKEYYTQNKEKYKKAEKKRFAILFFSKKRNPTPSEEIEVIEKLNRIRELHREDKLPNAKEGFGDYSIENSEHQVSRYQGGIIGWFSQNRLTLWEEKVLKAGFQLQHNGDISEIIETDKGFYLIRLVEDRKSKYLSFEKVENKIRYKVIKEKQLEIKEKFKNHLLEEFSLSINSEKLNGIQKSHDDLNHSNNTLPFKTIF